MEKSTLDPGLGEKYSKKSKRLANSDGSFNIVRRGSKFHPRDMYLYMISVSWPKFFGLVIASYTVMNCAFAFLYILAGIEHLDGAAGHDFSHSILNTFFFSFQTFTTVGYGGIVPRGILTNFIAAVEAFVGLMGFALATGLLYGRFSKPSTRIRFSKQAIITPYRGITALEFRIANERSNMLMEMSAQVLITFVETHNGETLRKYYGAKLERSDVYLFPLSWTIVHPITEDSPIFKKTADDLRELECEILILIKGFDETFGQNVHTMNSYCHDEIEWGVRFKKAFYPNEEGIVIMDLTMMDDVEPVQIDIAQEVMKNGSANV